MITEKDYLERAKEYSKEYGVEVSEHVINVISSVMMTRDKFLQGGSFVTSVVNNDLYSAINRADSECIKNLLMIVNARYHCHLNYHNE